MMWTLHNVKRLVWEKLPADLTEELITYVKANPPTLWGCDYSEKHLPAWCYLTLFRFVRRKSIPMLVNQLINFGFPLNPRTVEHNSRVLLQIFAQWGKTQIKLGKPRDWDEAAEVSINHVQEFLHQVRLWIDSSDFSLSRRKEWRSKKGGQWSYKNNRPAQHYMMFSDGKGRIRLLWGGYSPKVYDSDALKAFLQPCRRFKKIAFLGDGHFLAAAKHFKKEISIIAPTAEHKKKDILDGTNKPACFALPTSKEDKMNEAIRHLRARVETPFGAIKRRFECFHPYWPGNLKDQDDAIMFACGVHSWAINNQ